MAERPTKSPRDAASPPAAEGGATVGHASTADGYVAVTRDIRVSVRSFFLTDQSRPDEGKFVWAYRIKIENLGRDTVQLLKRTWRITDARGRTQRVHGDGVVGHQPVLEVGEMFEYTSGTPLDTPSGFMAGQYHMVISQTGEPFDVGIPTFSLDSPYENARLN
jgi:ApaG protein